MISAGGKYWPEAGSGAPTATSATAAANRTALAFMDAFLVCDLPVAPRDLPTRDPSEKIPSGAAPPNSPIRVARCASERRLVQTGARRFPCIAPEGPVEALSYHILRKKRNSPIAARKMKTSELPRSSEMHLRHVHANLACQLDSRSPATGEHHRHQAASR